MRIGGVRGKAFAILQIKTVALKPRRAFGAPGLLK
jgi:hypothetical protein